jgi:hypothetical protein
MIVLVLSNGYQEFNVRRNSISRQTERKGRTVKLSVLRIFFMRHLTQAVVRSAFIMMCQAPMITTDRG